MRLIQFLTLPKHRLSQMGRAAHTTLMPLGLSALEKLPDSNIHMSCMSYESPQSSQRYCTCPLRNCTLLKGSFHTLPGHEHLPHRVSCVLADRISVLLSIALVLPDVLARPLSFAAKDSISSLRASIFWSKLSMKSFVKEKACVAL